MNSTMIDSHAHIYLDQFKTDLDYIIKKSKNNNVSKILMPNINLKTVDAVLRLNRMYNNICFPIYNY